MKRNEYHVVPDGQGWKVEQGGKQVGRYDTKQVAVEAGRKAAHADEPSQLVVHTADGRIETEYTYKDDPYPPAG
ncbi:MULTISPECIES: DUF2188 domain-containing protein [Micromonospora]|uniref:DUF2188 domain-containing protein n=2 Tax=Micromonospora TaxID=1873 RepID=A0A1C6SDW9_9ACTN|nr:MULTISPECIES: DUF2188 domain-containing protein [Micromonospora]TWJ29286.1 uncharacterized protein DUF2188 [Micromonospora sagamiensis]BCL17687.1 hypothetical protein GCM10017556_54260 [Micromonospora sagamiensis]SCL27548.1 hypothetical protein GA0074694_4844 [Micromonospora inyonensis]